jgi:hypothetical protein
MPIRDSIADTTTFNSAVFACLEVIAFSYPEPPLTVFKKAHAERRTVNGRITVLDRLGETR